MKGILWAVGVFFALTLIVYALVSAYRYFNQATANLSIRTVEPGINCAILIDRTGGGNALSCYPSTNKAEPAK